MEESEDHGEGATEFVDIEGGGFDEGQGNENVSKDNEDLKEQVSSLCSHALYSPLSIVFLWMFQSTDDRTCSLLPTVLLIFALCTQYVL